MRWLIRIFALIGVAATLFVIWVATALLWPNWRPLSYSDVFSEGGLDPRQRYSVVWDRSEAPSRDGPFDLICFQLEEGGFAPARSSSWSWNASEPWEAKIRTDVMLGIEAASCIPEGEILSTETALLVRRVVYFGTNVSDAAVMFYHRPSRRLLYLDWST